MIDAALESSFFPAIGTEQGHPPFGQSPIWAAQSASTSLPRSCEVEV
jgi:hypothetical protein